MASTKLRAAFIAHSARPAGAELYLLNLCRSMRSTEPSLMFLADGEIPTTAKQLGLHTTVILEREPASAMSRWSGIGAMTRGFTSLLRQSLAMRRKSKAPVDVVVAWSTKALIPGYFVARKHDAKLVWFVHDRIASDYFGGLTARIVRTIGRALPDAYIANSAATMSTISVGPKPATVCYPGVSLLNPIRHTNRNSSTPLRITMVARLAPWKGQHILLEALKKLNPSLQLDVRIVGDALFGENEYKQQLITAAKQLPPSISLEFTGHAFDVAPYLEDTDIFVHASVLPEPFGLSVLEAMTIGCAVIATKPGGTTELVEDGVSGLLVDCGSVMQLADAITTLATLTELRETIGVAATHRADAFDLMDSTARLEVWLHNLVGAPLPNGPVQPRPDAASTRSRYLRTALPRRSA